MTGKVERNVKNAPPDGTAVDPELYPKLLEAAAQSHTGDWSWAKDPELRHAMAKAMSVRSVPEASDED